MTEEQQTKTAQAVIDAQIKILSAAYDKAVAYTHLLILAGYASFFGLWQLTREYLGRRHQVLSALLMLASISVFVVFEVVQTLVTSRNLLRYGRILNDPSNQASPERLQAAIEQFELSQRRLTIHFGMAWHAAFIVTLITGLAAVGILGCAFVSTLLAP